jgi:integrase
MVQVQRLTGMRPGEVCRLHPDHLDTSGPVWWYSPRHHKTAWRGKTRVIGIGPLGQAVLREFIDGCGDGWVFSPRRSMDEVRAARRAKTGNAPGAAKRKPNRKPGERYTTGAYRVAVLRAARRAGVAPWTPNQLRHAHATEVRKRMGLEAARAALGHASITTTEVYAERDKDIAGKVAREVG